MTGRKPNGHDTLTTLVNNQSRMQDDITKILSKIDYLYSVDPPGPLMRLAIIDGEHKQIKNAVFGDLAAKEGSDERKGLAMRVDELFSERRKILAGIATIATLIATGTATVIRELLHLSGH